MMLGKRQRPPIRRTTSMTGITADFGYLEAPASSDHHHHQNPIIIRDRKNAAQALEEKEEGKEGVVVVGPYNGYEYDQRFLVSMVSPRNHRRNSSSDQFFETAHFLRTCGFCNRRLAPARDIYMYRGDTAFCSVECREEQMKQDERKDGIFSLSAAASTKIKVHKHGEATSPTTATATSKAA